MAIVVNMPRLSDTMEEGTVAKWLKQVGDKVEEGDILAEIETDKATMEFESFQEGTLLHIGIQEGDSAPVDTLLAIIGQEGENISGLLKGIVEEESKADEKEQEEASRIQGSSIKDSLSPTELPAGVEVIKMPRLSDTMEEGTLATWLKKVGDKVEEGDILAEIETDKATMEFESFYSGTLLYTALKEGESTPVDQILAIIGPEGTNVEPILNANSKTVKTESTTKPEIASEVGKLETKTSQEAIKEVALNEGQRIFASPLAKKIASEKGVNLANITGSGDQGRIVKKDIENFVPSQKAASVTSAELPKEIISIVQPLGEEGFEDVKNNQMRKVIAKRLGESKFTAPHYYLTIEVAMDNAKDSRVQINSLPDTKVSFNDMVVKACAMALKKHPQVNTSWNNDTTRYNHHISIGVAVAVEDGLVVPVLKFTDQMGLSQIGAFVRDLASKARSKKLTPAEMEGSTFTVSNLGMFGIESFTSIINQPNSAILSVGAIIEKPVVKEGQLVVGNTMKLTLACDHRTVDGATAAQFLQTLRSFIENPVTMLA